VTRVLVVSVAAACLTLGACAPKKPAAQAKLEAIAREEQPEKLIRRGKTFASVGDYTRAEQYFVQAMEQGANPRVVMPWLLDACAADGRYRLAIKYAEEHLTKSPNDTGARFVLGALYSAVGESELAEKTLRRVVADAPKEADPHYALATLLRDVHHDSVGANTEFLSYLHLAPSGPHAPEARAALAGPNDGMPQRIGEP